MKRRVLFLCTGNSARSQIAESLLRAQGGDYFDVFSAGTSPQGIDVRSLEVLRSHGFPTEGLRSKSLSEFKGQNFDFVISLCDKATKECQNFPNAGEIIAWNMSDPKQKGGMAAFQHTLQALKQRIGTFVLVQTKDERTSS